MRVSLILAATPLGNPGDASARLIAALTSADVIAAEDSRRFHRLALLLYLLVLSDLKKVK